MMAQPTIHIFMFFVILLLFVTSVLSQPIANQTFELHKLRRIRAHLEKINKPPVKTIKSPDGDLIDCVLFNDQPAFDLPELKGQNPLDPPEWPKGYNTSKDTTTNVVENFQLWSDSGESCPEGTVPIRRTTEQDLLRASSSIRFGKKDISRPHEYAVVFVSGEQYYGAKAGMNVWAPIVADQNEFSLAQISLSAGSIGKRDLNNIEVGWQVNPKTYGDKRPRLFISWTRDAYQSTGCINLLCSGFVQTSKKIVLGAAISPISSYNNKQFDFELLVFNDPKTGNWFLAFESGEIVGYWPSVLFTNMKVHAAKIQFGGEIVNSRLRGLHTTTQMGSGHLAEEGYGKAAFIRNLEFIRTEFNDLDLIPVSNLVQYNDHPYCYDIRILSNKAFDTHFYYGGPGKNGRCP